MPKQVFKVGNTVTWQSHGGHADGKVVRVATADGTLADFSYKASKVDPRYIVETADGKRAAHTADALRKR